MADRQQRYTDFKDPFDLLTDLHSTRLRMVYQNEFARGDRSDIEMGTRAYPNSGVGRTFSPNYNLGVNAPSTQWQAREGSGRVLPPAVQMSYSRDYGDSTVRGRELQRTEQTIEKLGSSWSTYRKNIGKIRKENREKADAEATSRAEEERVSQYAPQMERLDQLTSEMADVEAQKEALSNRISMTKGIQEFRNTQRQAQAREVQAQNREGFFTASPNIPSSAKQEYPKGHPMGMLTEPDQGSVSTQVANIFKMQPSAPPAPSTGSAPMSFNVPPSNIPPGQTSPFPPINKTKNTTALGSNTPSPPSGYNPSQGTPPGPPPMHRRRRP